MINRPRLIWVGVILLTATFVMTGSGKLLAIPPSPENFTRWGLSMTVMRLVGVVEIGLGLALLVPRVTWLAAAGLGATMVGALRTGIVFGEPLHIALPVVLLVSLALVGYARRPWRRAYGRADT